MFTAVAYKSKAKVKVLCDILLITARTASRLALISVTLWRKEVHDAASCWCSMRFTARLQVLTCRSAAAAACSCCLILAACICSISRSLFIRDSSLALLDSDSLQWMRCREAVIATAVELIAEGSTTSADRSELSAA